MRHIARSERRKIPRSVVVNYLLRDDYLDGIVTVSLDETGRPHKIESKHTVRRSYLEPFNEGQFRNHLEDVGVRKRDYYMRVQPYFFMIEILNNHGI